MRWRIFYADGSTADSSRDSWRTAPARGALIAVWYRPDGIRRVECGADAIYWDENAEPCSLNLPTAELREIADRYAKDGTLKFGQLVPDELYERVWLQAIESVPPGG
jgi:hypothetical protein